MVVTVTLNDNMTIDLSRTEFAVGETVRFETVRFEVSNAREVRREFFIGDTAAHEEHAEEMRMGGHGVDARASRPQFVYRRREHRRRMRGPVCVPSLVPSSQPESTGTGRSPP